MKKISLIAILLMVFVFANSAFASASLTDIDGHTNEIAIQFLVDNNIVHGYPDGTYKPDTGINRAETLKLLFESKGGQGLVEPTEACFPDFGLDQWYAIYVCSALDLNRVEGYPDGNFVAGNNVNKVEFLKLLGEFAEWDLSEGAGEPLFDDTPEDAWYVQYLRYAKKKNLIEYEGTTYNPGDAMTRGSVAESIFRTALVKGLDTDAYDPADIPDYLGYDPNEGDDDTGTERTFEDAPLSAQDALMILETQLLDGHTLGSQAFVYQPSNTLGEDDYFAYYDDDADVQYVDLDEQVWFFWVDYHPMQLFFHETALATVDMEGNLEVYESLSYPYINGEAEYSVDTERIPSLDLTLAGDMTDEEIADLVAELSRDDPQFGACGADPNEYKRAIVAYFGEDKMIKRNAVNMYEHLCAKDYVTTVVTGNFAEDALDNLTTAIAAVEEESHDSGFQAVAFHVTSHGIPNTGDLHIGDTFIVVQGLTEKAFTIPDPSILPLDTLASVWGSVGFEIGEGGIWTDSFHIMHETCFSGNAIDAYQAEAYVQGTRETAVGWVAASSQSDQPSRVTPLAKYGAYFTQAVMQCQDSLVPYATMLDCLKGRVNKIAGMDLPFQLEQVPILEKLSPITDDSVPFLP